LARELEKSVEDPASTQAIFADDYGSEDRVTNQVGVMKDLVHWGPSFEYFLEPEKSWLVCDSTMMDYMWNCFAQEDLAIQIMHGM